MTRDEAWHLLNEYTKSESLIKHALAVEAAMRHYAPRFGENVETWGMTGLAASSVKKKMKQKSFAAAVKREDIEQGARLLGLPLDDHINHVIAAMQLAAGPLGFG